MPTTVSHEFTHLGINYNVEKPCKTSKTTVEARLQMGRNTTYALMGAGLHGVNGVNPIVSLHMYNTYVVPRVIFGLEFVTISPTEMKKLEVAHRKLLKNIQTLPKRASTPAIHILLGSLPIQATLEQRQITAIPSLADNGTILEIIISQLATKSHDSNSWVIATQKLLDKYELPSMLEVINSTDKESWKKTVKTAVHQHWKESIEEDAQQKSTLKFLNPTYTGKPHAIWSSTSHDSRDVRRANNKVRMVTGTYILQSTRSAFNQTKNTTCLLCGDAEEDMVHFIVQCSFLEDERQPLLSNIIQCIPLVYQTHPSQTWPPHLVTQLVLDPTHPTIQSMLPLQPSVIDEIERLSRLLCYKIHMKRCKFLGQNP